MANPVILKKGVSIGQPDAEADTDFLADCFVNNGDYDILRDINERKCVVLGRTGSGKTALLQELERQEKHAISLTPENLALNYVSNSNVIRFFEAAGVSLDPFYKLLWQHIFATELIKNKYDIINEEKQGHFLSRILPSFNRDKSKEKALNYLKEWGEQFWIKTEYRTKEFTEKLEGSLTARAGLNWQAVNAGVEGAAKLTAEEKAEVSHRGQQVVNSIQIKELSDIINILAHDIFTSTHERYYICLDRLDEDWVDDDLRFKLLKALLETMRTFSPIPGVKIVAALRSDLYYSLLKHIRSPGFQEEKYRPMLLQIRWNRHQLLDVLDRRVSRLYRRAYTKEGVRLIDILPPNQIEQRTSSEYLIERTFFRPREAIIFLNECLEQSQGETKVSLTRMRAVEQGYSQQRLRSLEDEWRREFPNLRKYTKLVQGKGVEFGFAGISQQDVMDFCEDFCSQETNKTDRLYDKFMSVYCNERDFQSVAREIAAILYQVGFLGVKLFPHLPRKWSFQDEAVVDDQALSDQAQLYVHKTFWAALGITSRR